MTDTTICLQKERYIERPPAQGDYITKISGCRIAPPDTSHPHWSAFLDRITNSNIDLQKFLQRFMGYCLTGVTSEHVFVFAYGTGANGKSTFINLMLYLFGDYACVTDVGTFLACNHERHPTDLAKLHGVRLVVAQETAKNRQWDETKIKTLTGGDKITARFMRQDFFDFVPQFKLFITGNHKPRLDAVDAAIRRRLLLVPFTVTIPPEERDTELPDKLKMEGPAILRWCVEGCLEWQRIGLAPPEIVTKATEDYFNEQDLLAQWLEECTRDAGPHAFITVGQLYASWRGWCDKRGIAPGGATTLSDALADRGFARKRIKGKRGFARLDLALDGSDDE